MSKKKLMAAADAATKEEDVQIIPLRKWTDDNNSSLKVSMIRQATVAYGIVELLIRCPENNVMVDNDAIISTENFAVKVCKKAGPLSSGDDVRGVSMISSGLFLSIEESSYMSCLFDEGGGGDKNSDSGQILGRDLEVELDASHKVDCPNDGRETISKHRCHYLLAKLLYELFAHEEFQYYGDIDEPAHKKARQSPLSELEQLGGSDSFSSPAIGRMQQLGVPLSLCRIVQNLLESASEIRARDAYKALGEVGKDLHLLLFDPNRFLFDNEGISPGNMQLLYNKERLYGRDEEETLITDAFCRVTRGRSEAFFIGGFSGSGKSMLVDTLRVRVKYVGGYVIKHKFDTVSQDRPLSGVISAVNQLCLKIKDTLKSQRLAALSKKIKDEFGADIVLLARMLPNICALSPEFNISSGEVIDGDGSSPHDNMKAQSVSFTLLRFIRLVSSPSRPIMVSYCLIF